MAWLKQAVATGSLTPADQEGPETLRALRDRAT